MIRIKKQLHNECDSYIFFNPPFLVEFSWNMSFSARCHRVRSEIFCQKQRRVSGDQLPKIRSTSSITTVNCTPSSTFYHKKGSLFLLHIEFIYNRGRM